MRRAYALVLLLLLAPQLMASDSIDARQIVRDAIDHWRGVSS